MDFTLKAPINMIYDALNQRFPGFVKYATTHTQYATSKVKKYDITEIRQFLIDSDLVIA